MLLSLWSFTTITANPTQSWLKRDNTAIRAIHYLLSYGAIALVALGYLSRQNATYMAYILPPFFLCVFPSAAWQPLHPIVQALPFFPASGHLLADAAALLAVTAVVVKTFKPLTFLAWILLLTHFLPNKCGFAVPSSARLLSDTVQALHYVVLIDLPVIMAYVVASPKLAFLTPTAFNNIWRMFQGCFVRNFVPLICIAFMPAATPLQITLLNGLGGACKWAMLGKYSFNSFSRGFVDVFLWGVLCATLPTWDRTTGAFTGYLSLLTYIVAAAAIEILDGVAALHHESKGSAVADSKYASTVANGGFCGVMVALSLSFLYTPTDGAAPMQKAFSATVRTAICASVLTAFAVLRFAQKQKQD